MYRYKFLTLTRSEPVRAAGRCWVTPWCWAAVWPLWRGPSSFSVSGPGQPQPRRPSCPRPWPLWPAWGLAAGWRPARKRRSFRYWSVYNLFYRYTVVPVRYIPVLLIRILFLDPFGLRVLSFTVLADSNEKIIVMLQKYVQFPRPGELLII